MEAQFDNAPCPDHDAVAVATMPVPSDHLYQIAALTFVLFLLVTIF